MLDENAKFYQYPHLERAVKLLTFKDKQTFCIQQTIIMHVLTLLNFPMQMP